MKRPLWSSDDVCVSGLAMCSLFSSTGSRYRTKCRDSARPVLRPPARCSLQSNPSNGCGICLGKDDRSASKVKLHSPILCIAGATTNRNNATVQHLARELYCHAECVIVATLL